MNKILQISEQLSLRQLELNDYTDIFHTINTQREYLGRWLPFVEFTQMSYSKIG
jgi:ribosomal-protein-serine acetyltransferase